MSITDVIVFALALLVVAWKWVRWTRRVRIARPWDSFASAGRGASGPRAMYSFSVTLSSSSSRQGTAYLKAPPPPFPTIPAIITLALIGAAAWLVLLHGETADTRKWAYGILGSVMGYWIAARS